MQKVSDPFPCEEGDISTSILDSSGGTRGLFGHFRQVARSIVRFFQLLSGYLGWLHRLHSFRVNPINMLRIAETRILKDNIDARRRVFLLGNCIVSPTVVRLISIEFLRTVEETL